jgi:uncharacterized membrane protein
MKKPVFIFSLLLLSIEAYCCTTCNKQVQDAIYDSTFYPNLLAMMSGFIVLTIIIIILSAIAKKRYTARLSAAPGRKELSAVPLTSAAAVLGIGTGGFADGIVLHQILQWHEMLSNKIPPDTLLNKTVNMFWDGIFHFFTLIVTLVGIYLLWKVVRRHDVNKSGYLMVGGMLGGWGLFNIVEGIIDHHLLKLHNVREISASSEAWNIGFLVFSVVLLLISWTLIKKGRQTAKYLHNI